MLAILFSSNLTRRADAKQHVVAGKITTIVSDVYMNSTVYRFKFAITVIGESAVLFSVLRWRFAKICENFGVGLFTNREAVVDDKHNKELLC